MGRQQRRGRERVLSKPHALLFGTDHVLGQAGSVNLPKLFFRHEVCSEMGGDSMWPFLVWGTAVALAVLSTELEHKGKRESVTCKHLGRQAAVRAQAQTISENGAFLSSDAAVEPS